MKVSLVPMVDLSEISDPYVKLPLLELATEFGLLPGSGNAVKVFRVWSSMPGKLTSEQGGAVRSLFSLIPDAHWTVWVTWS